MAYNPRQRLLELRVSEAALTKKLCFALAGGKSLSRVVWTAVENEIVVELESLRLAVRPGKIVVELIMTCDEFGRQNLVIPYNIGKDVQHSFLLAVVPENFGGHQGLARSWGEVSAKFVWQGCLDAMHMMWNSEDGLDFFEIQGLVGLNKEVKGLFGHPDQKDSNEEMPQYPVFSFDSLVDRLELAQIRLGTWRKGALVPQAVEKIGGKVSAVEFQNGLVLETSEVASLLKEKKVTVAGTTAVKRGGKLYLRSKPDARLDNNLAKLPPIVRR